MSTSLLALPPAQAKPSTRPMSTATEHVEPPAHTPVATSATNPVAPSATEETPSPPEAPSAPTTGATSAPTTGATSAGRLRITRITPIGRHFKCKIYTNPSPGALAPSGAWDAYDEGHDIILPSPTRGERRSTYDVPVKFKFTASTDQPALVPYVKDAGYKTLPSFEDDGEGTYNVIDCSITFHAFMPDDENYICANGRVEIKIEFRGKTYIASTGYNSSLIHDSDCNESDCEDYEEGDCICRDPHFVNPYYSDECDSDFE